jgi:hypothetical protein
MSDVHADNATTAARGEIRAAMSAMEAAAAAGPVGHGAIRLRGARETAPQAARPAPIEPAGHGAIRLRQPAAGPVDERPTTSAREDILAALVACGE